ncbi:MAG: mechanosensitive ion channel family protein [Candidatus Omnitrophota bacterium]|jgi:small conductance mechanosensitive channel
MTLQTFWTDTNTKDLLAVALRTLFILGIGWALSRVLHWGLKKFEDSITPKDVLRESSAILRLKTFSRLFKWLGSLTVTGLTVYLLLDNFGINVAPLLAGAGILGLAFGFGGQYLIRDIINGAFILIEDQYRINDVVEISGHNGLVESFNLRITKLRDFEGRMIYIPNGEVKTVINFTKDYSNAVLEIGIAYKENVDRVMQVLKELALLMRKDPYFGKLILEDLEMLGVDDFGESQITLKCRIKTLPIKQWEVAREFRRRVKNRFDELGIEIPFPHTTLYWGPGQHPDERKTP